MSAGPAGIAAVIERGHHRAAKSGIGDIGVVGQRGRSRQLRPRYPSRTLVKLPRVNEDRLSPAERGGRH